MAKTFTKAFLTGLKGIATAGSEIERLRFLPQKVEDGHIINFDGKSLVGKVEELTKDFEIFPLEEVTETKRLTKAKLDKYFLALDNNLLNILGEEVTDTNTVPKEKSDVLLDSLLEFAKAGDKKGARSVLKEIKDKWFALDDDIVEDAIEDIKDAIADKDVEGVKEIYFETESDGNDEGDVVKPDKEETPEHIEDKSTTDKSYEDQLVELADKEKDEDVNSLLLDLADAIKDDDKEDVKDLLLPELDSKHPAVKIVNAYLGNNDEVVEPVTEDVKEDDEPTDEEWIAEWKEDIDKAIEDKDIQAAKDLLKEFGEEFGEDEPEYKEYSEKLEEPTTTRRRRGRK